MQTRQLGRTDLQITSIGFGAWAIGGGGWAFSWGDQDDRESVSAIRKAVSLGINWIDTAAVYGLGHSEEIVGQALQDIPSSERPYVFTKSERTWDEQGKIVPSLKADSIKREVEGSLRRLQVDVIDLYQIHWPQPDEDIEEGWSAMAELQKAGKVRWIGVSNFNVNQLQRAEAIAPIASLQPPYSLLKREIEQDVLPFCQAHNIGVIVYSPMQSGLLSGRMTAERIAAMPENDWRRNNPFFKEPQLSRNLELVETLREIGNRHGRSPGEVAIAWTLNNPAVTAAIVGARNPEQVEGVIGAGDFRLTPEEVAEIEAKQKHV
jgi:aryl-alcohol dehydrogenase-like predicted oxidoreductase